MEIVDRSNLSADNIKTIKKNATELWYFYENDWHEIAMTIGIEHPAFKEVNSVLEKYNKNLKEINTK